jgi:hypothetical protein
MFKSLGICTTSSCGSIRCTTTSSTSYHPPTITTTNGSSLCYLELINSIQQQFPEKSKAEKEKYKFYRFYVQFYVLNIFDRTVFVCTVLIVILIALVIGFWIGFQNEPTIMIIVTGNIPFVVILCTHSDVQ